MKKTIVIILAAMLSFSASFAAYASEMTETVAVADKKPAKKKGEIKEVVFSVHLHCENCVAKVFDNLSRAKGVKDLHICLEDQIVEIKYDAAKTSEETLKAAIEKLGYPVAGKAGETEHGHHHHNHAH